MRPDHNTVNSMPYMRYSLSHQRRLQETRWAERAAYILPHLQILHTRQKHGACGDGQCHLAAQVYHAANGHRVLSTRTMLGVTTAGPALLAQASSTANKVLRSCVLILPMHKGVRERVTAKRRPWRFTCGFRKWVTRHFGGQFAFVKHCLEGGTLFVSCTWIFRVFPDFQLVSLSLLLGH